ncbi:hypothetical protein FQN54_009354 [Arachnomyces sp. PD_36]|nr:hypothetical protein FQN54_009354 [Arachnomyces sp. PD_36]
MTSTPSNSSNTFDYIVCGGVQSETFHPTKWFEARPEDHGSSGPLNTDPRELAPISKLLMKSFESQGFPYDADMFSHGRNPHGYGHITRTHFQGCRSMSTAYLSDQTSLHGSLRVVTNATVDRVVFDQGPDKLRATAIVFILYETDKQDLTTDNLIYQKNGYKIARDLWREKKTGFLASSPFGIGAFARLDERLKDSPEWVNAPREPGRDPMGLTTKQPNIELFTTECYGGLKKLSDFPEGKQAFGIVTELFSPKSRGAVTITSPDPMQKPRVDHNYLADPLDILVLAEACQLGHEIITKGAGTAEIVKGSWPKEAAHHTRTTRDSWAEYVRENAVSGFHAAGTCKMGKPDDPTAVLDHKLRVLGIENLRVADCSVMPQLNGGHTQMPAYGIGEKAADLIKGH